MKREQVTELLYQYLNLASIPACASPSVREAVESYSLSEVSD